MKFLSWKFGLFFLAAQAGIVMALVPSGNKGVENCQPEEPSNYNPCKGFDRIAGKLDEVEKVVIGEFHDSTKKVVQCVNALSKNAGEHTVYLEGFAAGKQVSCQEYHPLLEKPGRTCKGMDDEKANLALSQLVRKGNQNKQKMDNIRKERYILKEIDYMADHYAAHKAAGKSDKAFGVVIDDIRMKVSSNALKMSKDNQEALMRALNWIKKEKSSGKSYDKVFKAPYDPEGSDDKKRVYLVGANLKEIEKLDEKRDEAMRTMIKEHPTKRLGFFIMGREHVVKDRRVVDKLEQLRKELESENPFAVLAMQ